MPQQKGIGLVVLNFGHNLAQRHGPKLRVQQLYFMPGIEQWPAQGQQPKRGQMFARDTAADGRMRRINEQDFHRLERFILVVELVAEHETYLCVDLYFVSQSDRPVKSTSVQAFVFEPRKPYIYDVFKG